MNICTMTLKDKYNNKEEYIVMILCIGDEISYCLSIYIVVY